MKQLAVLVLAGSLVSPALAAPVRLPPHSKTTLKNGLVVFVMPTQRLPLVDLLLVARAGSVNDPVGKEGLASLTADLLNQGAGKRSAKQFAEDIAFVGGVLGASASSEQLSVSCEVPKKDLSRGLELFRDAIVFPGFPEQEFQRKKSEALGGIAAQRDDPGAVADIALGPFLMGASPLAHPAFGWQKSVESLRREDVVSFHREYLTPDNAMLAVVGDVDPKLVVPALEKAFAAWKPSGKPHADAYGPLAHGAERRVMIVSKPEVTQTQVRFACPGVRRNDPDFYPIEVANTILGGGFTSRLTNEIRVIRGLAYDISSDFEMYRNAGVFVVATATRNEMLRKTIDETLRVMKKLVDEGPTEQELAKAKRYLTGLFPLRLQAPDALAGQILNIEFYGLDPHYVGTYSDRINAVTMDDVRRVLKSHVCIDDARILVVSKPDMAKTALKGLGPLEVRPVP